jgi:hypothetical protein
LFGCYIGLGKLSQAARLTTGIGKWTPEIFTWCRHISHAAKQTRPQPLLVLLISTWGWGYGWLLCVVVLLRASFLGLFLIIFFTLQIIAAAGTSGRPRTFKKVCTSHAISTIHMMSATFIPCDPFALLQVKMDFFITCFG